MGVKILSLDPKGTHEHNPDCPMLLIPSADGRNWQCFNCGCYIIKRLVEVEPIQVDVLRSEPVDVEVRWLIDGKVAVPSGRDK